MWGRCRNVFPAPKVTLRRAADHPPANGENMLCLSHHLLLALPQGTDGSVTEWSPGPAWRHQYHTSHSVFLLPGRDGPLHPELPTTLCSTPQILFSLRRESPLGHGLSPAACLRGSSLLTRLAPQKGSTFGFRMQVHMPCWPQGQIHFTSFLCTRKTLQ